MLIYLLLAAVITYLSWFIARIVLYFISNTKIYRSLANLSFSTQRKSPKIIGLIQFKWMIENSPLKLFNQKINLTGKHTDLHQLRKEMTRAEVGHFLAFGMVTIGAMFAAVIYSLFFALILMMVNILMNLYPSLLQQHNKGRLDRLISRSAALSPPNQDALAIKKSEPIKTAEITS